MLKGSNGLRQFSVGLISPIAPCNARSMKTQALARSPSASGFVETSVLGSLQALRLNARAQALG
jgi:hypothetical protein